MKIDAKKSESLGLTLVHLLVEQLKGTMEIVSDTGTRFRIRFPDTTDLKEF